MLVDATTAPTVSAVTMVLVDAVVGADLPIVLPTIGDSLSASHLRLICIHEMKIIRRLLNHMAVVWKGKGQMERRRGETNKRMKLEVGKCSYAERARLRRSAETGEEEEEMLIVCNIK